MRLPLTAGARLWWGLPVLLVLLWAAGAFALQAFPGLPQPPELTLWALPIARFARDVAAILTVGSLVIGVVLAHTTSAAESSRRVLRWATVWAIAWLCALVVLLVVTMSDVFAASPTDVLNPRQTWAFLTELVVGRVFLAQLIVAAVIAACAWRARATPAVWILAVAGVAASAAPAFLGHGGMDTAHTAATVSLGLHIAAVSVWVGGLAILVALAVADRTAAVTVLPMFSLVALWCVVVTAETGLLNATLRVGTTVALVGTVYGTLVLAKAVLLGYLVRLGWLQRTRVIPDLRSRPEPSLRLFARFAGYEVIIMGVAIAVSVALSRIGPSTAILTAQRFTPLAVVLLGLAIPLFIAWATPAPTARWIVRLRTLPELPAVLLLVVVAEVSALGLLGSIVSDQFGTLLGAVLIVAAGWLWAACASHSVSSTAILIVGWPAVMWLASRTATIPSGWKASVVALVVAEGLLVAVLVRARSVRPARETVTAA